MTLETRCAAIRMSDQYHCRVCRLVWDVDDQEPPTCGRQSRVLAVAEGEAKRTPKVEPAGKLAPLDPPLEFASGVRR